MKNEQKVKELSEKYKRRNIFSPKEYSIENCLLDMAEWKDEQLIDKLREVLSAHMHGGEIDEVLAELDEKMKGE